MEEKKISVDPMALAFAKVMTVFTIIGIALMVAPSIPYFMGYNQYISLQMASKYWNESTVNFWKHVKGITVHGYDWIFTNLEYTDCQSMIGVLLLMITPLLSMISAIPKADQKVFKLLLLLAAVEFAISMIVKGIL